MKFLRNFLGQDQQQKFGGMDNGMDRVGSRDPSETGSEISHATSERDLPEMTEGDSDSVSWG